MARVGLAHLGRKAGFELLQRGQALPNLGLVEAASRPAW